MTRARFEWWLRVGATLSGLALGAWIGYPGWISVGWWAALTGASCWLVTGPIESGD